MTETRAYTIQQLSDNLWSMDNGWDRRVLFLVTGSGEFEVFNDTTTLTADEIENEFAPIFRKNLESTRQNDALNRRGN